MAYSLVLKTTPIFCGHYFIEGNTLHTKDCEDCPILTVLTGTVWILFPLDTHKCVGFAKMHPGEFKKQNVDSYVARNWWLQSHNHLIVLETLVTAPTHRAGLSCCWMMCEHMHQRLRLWCVSFSLAPGLLSYFWVNNDVRVGKWKWRGKKKGWVRQDECVSGILTAIGLIHHHPCCYGNQHSGWLLLSSFSFLQSGWSLRDREKERSGNRAVLSHLVASNAAVIMISGECWNEMIPLASNVNYLSFG